MYVDFYGPFIINRGRNTGTRIRGNYLKSNEDEIIENSKNRNVYYIAINQTGSNFHTPRFHILPLIIL